MLDLGLLCGVFACFAPACSIAFAQAEGQVPEIRLLEASDGYSLSIQVYRPTEDPSAAILLLTRAEAASTCWGSLPRLLCEAGFQVLALEPRVQDMRPGSDSGDYAEELPDAQEADRLLEDVLRCLELVDGSARRLALVAIGWTGWLGFDVALADGRCSHLVWISPQVWPATDWSTAAPDEPDLTFLLVASPSEVTSSALAGDLFSRFNAKAELRLLSRRAGGCALIQHEGLCTGVADWLSKALNAGP